MTWKGGRKVEGGGGGWRGRSVDLGRAAVGGGWRVYHPGLRSGRPWRPSCRFVPGRERDANDSAQPQPTRLGRATNPHTPRSDGGTVEGSSREGGGGTPCPPAPARAAAASGMSPPPTEQCTGSGRDGGGGGGDANVAARAALARPARRHRHTPWSARRVPPALPPRRRLKGAPCRVATAAGKGGVGGEGQGGRAGGWALARETSSLPDPPRADAGG